MIKKLAEGIKKEARNTGQFKYCDETINRQKTKYLIQREEVEENDGEVKRGRNKGKDEG